MHQSNAILVSAFQIFPKFLVPIFKIEGFIHVSWAKIEILDFFQVYKVEWPPCYNSLALDQWPPNIAR